MNCTIRLPHVFDSASIKRRWVPVKERSRSLALVYSGMYTGSILGLAVSPHMVEILSWPSVFYIFGLVGVLWYSAWQAKASSSPAADPAITAEEREYIEETSVKSVSHPVFSHTREWHLKSQSHTPKSMNPRTPYNCYTADRGSCHWSEGWADFLFRPTCSTCKKVTVYSVSTYTEVTCSCLLLQDPAQSIPWGKLLSKAPVWALIVSHFCHNWGTFILLTWMPTYYNQVAGAA